MEMKNLTRAAYECLLGKFLCLCFSFLVKQYMSVIPTQTKKSIKLEIEIFNILSDAQELQRKSLC